MSIRSLLPLLLAAVSPSAFALDAACESVLKASEARMKQPAWHSVIDLGGGMRMEAIKANGQFFQQIEGKWSKFAVNLDAAEASLLAEIRSGEVKLTDCKVLGTEVLEGMQVTVVSSRTEIEGAPPGSATLYIGQQDGLPYRQTAEDATVTYRYKEVVAPKL